MAKLILEKISAAAYESLVTKNAETIYWLENGTIYVGGHLYGGKVAFITADPENPELNTLYVDLVTKKVKTYDGISLKVVSNGFTEDMTAALAEGGDGTLAPTAKAVYDYLEENYSKTDLVVTAGKYMHYTDEEGVVHSEIWLSIAPKGAEDPWAKEEDIIKIPVGDLIDTYTGGDTSSISVSVDNNNVITANVKLHEATNNALVLEDDGLYVNISGKADKVGTGHENEVALYDAEGNLTTNGKKIGGATLAATVDANTVATEQAVKTYADSLITWTNWTTV